MLNKVKIRTLQFFVLVAATIIILQPVTAYSQVKLDTSARDAAIKDFNNTLKVRKISSREVFPDLPPSSLCETSKIVGIWKLLMVYESPSDREIDLYLTNPLQYQVFESDSLYGEYVSILHNISLRDVREYVLNKSNRKQQFTVDKSGMLFLYRNGIAYDSLACFIVESTQPPFRYGQLLLMPPEKASAGRRVLKVYEKVYIEFESPYYTPKPVENKKIETKQTINR